MKWKKLGLIYNKENYNSVPIAHFTTESIIRIYASSRNEKNQSFPYFIDYDIENQNILSNGLIKIPLGNFGTFDEDGIMPTEIKEINGKIFMYYIGWNVGKSVPFRNSIGLAISEDGGSTFTKYSEGPILDRSEYDKCFVASNCVFQENNVFRMYYLSCDKWEYINEKLTHSYNIKIAESTDGILWKREGRVAIDFKYDNECAISVPRVLKENGVYKMWYSYRGGLKSETYRIGYAESENGIDWLRKDEEVGIDVSESGWDSEMICYPFIFDHKGKRYMLYNGNGYGKTGIGLAVLEN